MARLLKKNAAIQTYLTLPLSSGQQRRSASAIDFTFNLGAGVLQRSTLRKKVNRGEHDDVPAEFMK